METSPRVSVIMPAYNAEKTLPYAIDSILRQTMGDLELIIVDDASFDDTAEIIRHYTTRDARVRQIRTPRNSRLGPIQFEPKNHGLVLAAAPVIAYLDADNEWHPAFLATMIDVLQREPLVQLAHCDSRNHYSAEEKAMVIRNDRRQLVMEGDDWTVFSYSSLEPGNLGFSQYIDTNEIVHRASIFGRLNTLWRTTHPRRAMVNASQSIVRPDRRHNDLDLVERVLEEFGPQSIFHHAEVLVYYYYPSYPRPPHPLSIQPH